MKMHRKAKLGLGGRHELVCRIEGGMTQKAAAAAFCVSPGDGQPLVAALA